eukprot:CAMPEP_0203781436 /NCGR_PEP_ID=MMETSP0099_2-20121227/10233_1 /ASSEMBLY_ACC=CAM_ASM_000209 /TAXON_ID=96639 /ORGANISM=" , Strain NY0313808BC1" /LENGTH=422 /DNA_ID=CAMNT_0050682419 /DNA_START=153 /DNA_END=1421 /DNA_ORIENTATION=+
MSSSDLEDRSGSGQGVAERNGVGKVGDVVVFPMVLCFKIGYFGVAVGLSAQAVMWKSMHESFYERYGIPAWVSYVFWFSGLFALLLCVIIYVIKAINWPYAVLAEATSPIRAHFFFTPTLAMSFLLTSAPNFIVNHTGVSVVFYFILSFETLLRLFMWGEWLVSHHVGLAKVYTPAMLSVVNCFVLAGLAVGPIISSDELATALVAIGLLFYLTVFIRTFGGRPTGACIPDMLLPALFFYMAPLFSVAIVWPSLPIVVDHPSTAGVEISPGFDSTLAALFFYLGLFMYLLLLRFSTSFMRLPFMLTWWAYTFPTASAGIASIKWAAGDNQRIIFAMFLCGVSTFVVVFILAIMLGKVCNARSFSPLLPEDDLVKFHLDKELMQKFEMSRTLSRPQSKQSVQLSFIDHICDDVPWQQHSLKMP